MSGPRAVVRVLTYAFMACCFVFVIGHALAEYRATRQHEIDDGVLLVLSEGRAFASLSFYFEVRHDGGAFLETLTGVRESWQVPPGQIETAKRSLFERGFATMRNDYSARMTPESERGRLSLNDGTTKKTVHADSADPDSQRFWEAAAAVRDIFGLDAVRARAWERWRASQIQPTKSR